MEWYCRSHTPDVIPLPRPAAGILMAQESEQVDVVALELAGLAVLTGRRADNFIAVDVKEAVGNVIPTLCHLALPHRRHAHGIGRAFGTQEVGVKAGDLLSGGRAGQGGQEDGGEACLHLDVGLAGWGGG